MTQQLKVVAAEVDRLAQMVGTFDPTIPPDEVTAEYISGILEARRRRDQLFGKVFRDPGWDVILAVFALQLADKRPTITDVARLSGVPGTTALRWVKQLVSLGLLVEKDDNEDARLVLLELSRRSKAAMAEYFHAGAPSGRGI